MKDYLKEYCESRQIGLIYVDTEPAILSAIIHESRPVIKASRIFSECPKEVAYAIINFYTDFKDQEKYLGVINDYAEDNLITVDYEIQTADEKFINSIKSDIKKGEKKEDPVKVLEDKSTSSLVEMDISSITKKDFQGNIAEIGADEVFKASSDDVVELDIVISPFDE